MGSLPQIYHRLLLPAFAAHSFGVEPSQETPNLHIPCIHSSPDGWDFDYAPFLLADKLVMDKLSIEFITNSGLSAHRKLREAINVMSGEGILDDPIDGAAIIRQHQRELTLCNQAELNSPIGWRTEVRAAIDGWKKPGLKLANTNDGVHKESQLIPFGIWLLTKRLGIKLTLIEAQRIDSIFSEQKVSFTNDEETTFKEIVSAYITVVHQNLLLAREAQAAVFDGANFQPLYRQKLLKSSVIPGAALPAQTQRAMDKIHELFALAIPSYTPRSAAEFVALHKDSRRIQLRNLILDAMATERPLDNRFFDGIREDFILATRSADRIRNIVWWATRPLMLIDPTHIAASVVEKGADKWIEHHHFKAHQWHVFLVEQRSRLQNAWGRRGAQRQS